MRLAAIIIFCLAVPAIGFSATILVPGHFPTIQGAINAAVNGDEVLVSPGTYVENIDFIGKAITVTSVQGPDVTFIDGNQNGSVVIFQSGEGSGTVLEGFTIRNGTGTWFVHPNWAGYVGGGISCRNASSPVIRNNIITKNTAVDSTQMSGGGGIDCEEDSSPLIKDNIITENIGDFAGGFETVDSSPKFINNTVSGNTANLSGGGIYLAGGDPEVSNNTITYNSAQWAGATQIENGNPIIMSNFISRNKATNICGGIRCIGTTALIDANTIYHNSGPNGGGLQMTSNDKSVITNNLFAWNSATNGGGIRCYQSEPTVTNNVFAWNEATIEGGGISCNNSTFTAANNLFLSNSANRGGGIDIYTTSTVTMNNNTFINNSANKGGGIACRKNSDAVITDTILWDNIANNLGPEIFIGSENSPSKVTISYSNVNGGQASVYIGTNCTLIWGTGMINANPLFAAGPSGFQYLGQTAAGQPATSPCVDTGSALASSLGMNVYWTRTDEVTDSGMVDMGYHYGDFLFPSLQTDIFALPETTGGTANFLLLAGADNAYRTYILLGGISGMDPGTPLPGGEATLPLNWDFFTNVILQYLNSSIFKDFMGILEINGSGVAQFNLGPIPGVAPMTLYFAYALNEPWDFVSNPVAVEIL